MRYKDLTGQPFDLLTIRCYAGNNKRGDALWLCDCRCGGTVTVKTNNLTSGHTGSCGCIPTGPHRHDEIIGTTFDNITVTSFHSKDKHRASTYNFECSCGYTGQVRYARLGKYNPCPKCRSGSYEAILGCYWNTLKHNAKKRKIPFSITKQEAWQQFINQGGICALSGTVLLFSKERQDGVQTASLDRIDSKQGYTPTNIQWVHKDLNCMKWDLSTQEFVEWCRKVVNYVERIDSKGSTDTRN